MGINALRVVKESLDSTNNVDNRRRKQLVCMHWWPDNKCKKGADECGFLHTYIPEKVPVCKTWARGFCPNFDSCKYRHPQQGENGATKKQEPCPYYERGFCKAGTRCPFLHEQSQVCENYLLGFCPQGPNCKFAHVKSMISPEALSLATLANFPP